MVKHPSKLLAGAPTLTPATSLLLLLPTTLPDSTLLLVRTTGCGALTARAAP
jgi:hypothetical protein